MIAHALPQLAWLVVPFSAYYIGLKLERLETERMSLFRDKSALYGSATPPATPSWP